MEEPVVVGWVQAGKQGAGADWGRRNFVDDGLARLVHGANRINIFFTQLHGWPAFASQLAIARIVGTSEHQMNQVDDSAEVSVNYVRLRHNVCKKPGSIARFTSSVTLCSSGANNPPLARYCGAAYLVPGNGSQHSRSAGA